MKEVGSNYSLAVSLPYRSVYWPFITRWFPFDAYDSKTCSDTLPLHRIAKRRAVASVGPTFLSKVTAHGKCRFRLHRLESSGAPGQPDIGDLEHADRHRFETTRYDVLDELLAALRGQPNGGEMRSAGGDFPCELLCDGSGVVDCTALLYPLRFPGTHAAHKYAPSPPFLPFSPFPLLLSPLSPQLEMSGPLQAKAEQSEWQVKRKLKKAYDVVTLHLSKHTGVGFVCAVAYFDPYVFLSFASFGSVV